MYKRKVICSIIRKKGEHGVRRHVTSPSRHLNKHPQLTLLVMVGDLTWYMPLATSHMIDDNVLINRTKTKWKYLSLSMTEHTFLNLLLLYNFSEKNYLLSHTDNFFLDWFQIKQHDAYFSCEQFYLAMIHYGSSGAVAALLSLAAIFLPCAVWGALSAPGTSPVTAVTRNNNGDMFTAPGKFIS